MPFRKPGHQETAREGRHRDGLVQQLSAEILREASDLQALEIVAHRVLTRSDVRQDSQLESTLRAFVGQCRSEVQGRMERQRKEENQRRDSLRPSASFFSQFVPAAAPAPLSSRELNLRSYERLRRLLDEKLAAFDVDAGGRLLGQIQEFQQLHPDVVSAASLERCRMDLARSKERRDQFLAEVDLLGQAAIRAARAGKLDESTKALKRLSSIRASRPTMLSEARLNEIRVAIENAGDHFEHREANRELVRRERDVSEELRKLAMIVHEFHVLSHEIPIGDPRYAAAEQNYRAAVREVRHHDQEWFADLMVELDELQDEVHDTTGRAAEQVARFLHSVKVSIAQIVKEIREVAAEQKQGGPAPAANNGIQA